MKNQPLILSTAHFPPIEYWVAISQHSQVFIEAHENYQKQTYRNRCRILGPNGVQDLGIPVAKSGKIKNSIVEVQIFDDQLWQKVHWKSIETAYNSSPFFLYYADYFEDLFIQKQENLLALNTRIMELVFDILELNQRLSFTKSFEKSYDDALDLRAAIHPKKESPFYLMCKNAPYIQVFSERYAFVPNLSILDLIFNLGPEAERYLSEFDMLYAE